MNNLVLWFTGLSGSGKSTLAKEIDYWLNFEGYDTFILDGDILRKGLCSDLGFSPEDRSENIRRVGEIIKLLYHDVFLTTFISPYKKDRDFIKKLVGKKNFVEIFCDCSLDICEQRDTKGLYKKARKGKIKNFTGISDPYEKPTNPNIHLDTGKMEIEACIDIIINYLERNYLCK